MKSELPIRMPDSIQRAYSSVRRFLPGEYYGRQVSASVLDLSPYHAPRDISKALGLAAGNKDTIIRARFFYETRVPWENKELGDWEDIAFYDAVEKLCQDDIPDYISSTDIVYSTGVRIVSLEAGRIVRYRRYGDFKMPYCQMDALHRGNEYRAL